MARSNEKIPLLENGSATGAWMNWHGGKGSFIVEATYGGGSVVLEAKLPSGAGTTIVSTTASGFNAFDLPQCEIRAKVTTATAVYAYAVRTGRI